jgi:hypothetical protein
VAKKLRAKKQTTKPIPPFFAPDVFALFAPEANHATTSKQHSRGKKIEGKKIRRQNPSHLFLPQMFLPLCSRGQPRYHFEATFLQQRN